MRKEKIFVILSSIMSIVLLASNLMAAKLWRLWDVPVDGGLLFFPASYVVGDMLVELYGEKKANFVAQLAVILNVAAMVALGIAVYLPPYPGWDGQDAYAYIFSFSARITLGSLAGFLLSQVTNNYAFLRIRRFQFGGQERVPDDLMGYKLRAIGSSLIGRLVDNIVFETISFLGILPLRDFGKQFIGAYLEGLVVEVIIAVTIAEPIIRRIGRYISLDKYDIKD